MDWQIEITDEAEKQLAKMGAAEAKRIFKFLNDRLQQAEHPRRLGATLKGTFRDYWRYRVGDYRIICRLEASSITVFVVHVEHRSDI